MAAGDVETNLTQNNSFACAKTDGVDDIMVTSPVGTFNYGTTRDFSFSFWFKSDIDLAAATARLISKTKISTGNGFFTDITNNKFRFFTKSGATYKIEIDSAVIFYKTWRHIAITIDRDVGSKIYIDGAEVAATETNLANLATDDISSIIGINVAKLDTQAVNLANGFFADIRFFSDKLLTAAEVTKIYAKEQVAGVTGVWNFENGDYKDSIGSNDLVNTGAYITINDDAIAKAISDDRTTANDNYLIWNGLHGKVGSTIIEEA